MKSINQEKRFLLAISAVLLLTVIVTAQSLLLGHKVYTVGGEEYTHYNNYVIFKQSFFHLLDNTNLYKLYLTQQWDLYKYSPTFSLFMATMAYLPDWLGLFVWNGLNSFVLFYALWKFVFIKEKHKLWVLLFVAVELVTSMQNAQSNGLIAGLVILAFNLLEKRKIFWAVFFLSLTVYIKIFGLAAFLLVLMYPNRLKGIAYGIFWMLVLAILPLCVISVSDLVAQYQNWGVMLQQDHSASIGISVSGFVAALSSWQNNKVFILLVGTVFLIYPLLKFKLFNSVRYRLLYLASILIWVVIFNHKAESPTFIIAISGVAIWFFANNRANDYWQYALLFLALIFTSLSSTDLFPKFVRDGLITPYAIKAVPCILVWGVIVYEQILAKMTPMTTESS